MGLKIIDDFDLKGLEQFGFKFGTNDISQPAWVLEKHRLEYNISVDGERRIWVESLEYGGILTTLEEALSWDNVFEILIQKGIVEKV